MTTILNIAPNSFVQGCIDQYISSHAMACRLPVGRSLRGHYAPNNPEEQKAIAMAYEALPYLDDDIEVLYAYAALKSEIELQYNFALRNGFKLQAWGRDGQPYANSEEMATDVRYHKHLWYFTGGEEHPFLLESNLKLRAIHDLFGHASEGYQFGPRGEINAWIHHSMMFSPLAQRALTTETHGQNSWSNFGPNAHIPVAVRPFADQKVALLPDEYCDWRKWLA